jgi:hypothetical protein
MVLVGAVEGRNERAAVESVVTRSASNALGMISSCRSERSPRPESQIPMIDNPWAAACSFPDWWRVRV